MSKIKQYIVSSVENAVDKICGLDNIEMVVEKHLVEEMLIIEKEDYWKKANAEGRSQ